MTVTMQIEFPLRAASRGPFKMGCFTTQYQQLNLSEDVIKNIKIIFIRDIEINDVSKAEYNF
jgi:hypothetical protein